MEVLLGFLTPIAADLLKMTYLNITQPDSSAESILTPLQIKVLAAESLNSKRKIKQKLNTIAWAIQEIARLGGYARTQEKQPNWHYSFVAWMVGINLFM